MRQCVEVGLVQGKHLSVDGSFVEANAAKESRIPRQQLAEAAQVNRTVRQYLVELEEQNPVEEPVHEQDQVSTTDPDSTYATKGGTPARLGYYDNYLVDNQSCVIVGVQATAARMSQDCGRTRHAHPFHATVHGAPESLAADTTYGVTGSSCNGWRIEASLLTCEPAIVSTERTARSMARSGSLISRKATAIAAPQVSNSTTAVGVIATAPMYTSEPANGVGRARKERNARARPSAVLPFTCMNRFGNGHANWPKRQSSRRHRQRKKVEALFAELKNQIGLRRLRLRRLKFVREQFFLAAAAQNIKRLVRFLSKAPNPKFAAAA